MELHKRDGDIVRYGPNRLSFITPEALQAIYGSRANTKKSFYYDVMTFYMQVKSTHATTDKAQHARKRRILSQALSERIVHVYEEDFKEILKSFLERYQGPATQTNRGWPPPFNMEHESKLLNFNSIGKFCFREPFGSIKDPRRAEIIETTLKGFRGLNAVCTLTESILDIY
jgi:cytochrome P450